LPKIFLVIFITMKRIDDTLRKNRRAPLLGKHFNTNENVAENIVEYKTVQQ
jgi:hypothetical protein